MIVYRLSKAAYGNDLAGTGAKMYGGRWNSKGIAMLYTAATRSLAALEILVHVPSGVPLRDFVLLTIDIPDNNIHEISFNSIKKEIESNGLQSRFYSIGDKWIKSNVSLILKVPSVIIHEEHNYLVNPYHPDFKKVKLISKEDFVFDGRL